MGWYKNNYKAGNYMCVNGKNLEVKESGWYTGYKILKMREHDLYKNFNVEDVFIDYFIVDGENLP